MAGAIETLTLQLRAGADATTVDGMNTFATINVLNGGHHGLLGLALAPDDVAARTT